MNKTVIITIGIILSIAVVVVVVWLLLVSTQPVTQSVSESTNTGGSQQEGSTSDEVPLSTEATTSTITIENMMFTPASTTVKRGTTVTWISNDGENQHAVVSDSDAPVGGPPLDNPPFVQGGSYQFTYETVGTFPYHCPFHPTMHGTVTVTE